MEPKEKDIERSIIQYLRHNRIYCEKQESGVAYRKKGGKTYAIHMSQEGAPDISACVPVVITQEMVGQTVGVYCGIEVKRNEKEKNKWMKYDHKDVFKQKGYDRRTEMQKTRRDEITQSGGRFILASSLEDVHPAVQGQILD